MIFKTDLDPLSYRRYVDGIFALFFCPDHAHEFKEDFSIRYHSNFCLEKEKDVCLF